MVGQTANGRGADSSLEIHIGRHRPITVPFSSAPALNTLRALFFLSITPIHHVHLHHLSHPMVGVPRPDQGPGPDRGDQVPPQGLSSDRPFVLAIPDIVPQTAIIATIGTVYAFRKRSRV